ncbi:sulfite exporter TauE/SafE family protein [Ahrensia sp. 13_GOM-1096m]|uniref:sulfite exporter TauE/SafE family protein n=1 Tax=Ahrensia sp. 13_GOM-1096m TaxID=1380380 RepID=UPI0009DECE09|nr:sulfite exporter TauE/SafE family protein [Ahrensia sp. 13_GOM-1096m]
MIELIYAHLANPASQIVLCVVFITGIVRGFSGFGTGMLVGPVTAALFTPKIALALIAIIDSVPAIALAWSARHKTQWREVLPLVLGYLVLMPLGIYVLKTAEPIAMRWFICISIALAVTLLWGGFKYRGPRSKSVSVSVGAASGFMGAAAGLPGPPALLYWMAGDNKAAQVRANMIFYLFLTDIIILIGYYFGQIFTAEAIALGILAMLPYFIGLHIGAKCFIGASEVLYKRVAFSLILAASILALPLLDNVLR